VQLVLGAKKCKPLNVQFCHTQVESVPDNWMFIYFSTISHLQYNWRIWQLSNQPHNVQPATRTADETEYLCL
jgi:hypothetical protein